MDAGRLVRTWVSLWVENINEGRMEGELAPLPPPSTPPLRVYALTDN